MRDKKIMFFDIDGTLLPFSHKHVSEKMIKALSKLQEKGVRVVIATGRKNGSIAHIFGDFKADALITSNGRQVEVDGKVIYEQPIPIPTVEKLINYDNKYKVGLNYSSATEIASYNGTTEKGIAYLARLHEIQPHIDKNFHNNHTILQAMIYADTDIEQIFKDDFPELEFIRHKQDGIDVLSAGPMKEKGIEIVLDYFSLSKADALAFGDGLNDLGMFQYIDGVALGVAHPELIEISKDQIGVVEEDSIYDYLISRNYIEE